jgi:hypothetical protein
METPRIESLNETQKRLLAEEILAHADMVRHAQEATEAAQDQTDIRHDQLLELFEKYHLMLGSASHLMNNRL